MVSIQELSAPSITIRYDPDCFFEKHRFLAKNLGDEILQQYSFISMSDNIEELYIYENGVYSRENAENTIRVYATDALDDRATKACVDATVYYIKTVSLTRRERVNAHKSRINLKNGIFNLKTWRLEPHSPEFLSTIQIPVDYDPIAECPAITKFLFEILPVEDIAMVMQLFGYVLIPDRRIQKAFMFTGEGSNGKGSLMRLLQAFSGRSNHSNVSLKELNEDKFAVAGVYGKLINICGDLPSGNIEDDTVFKKITGKDTLRGERKYEMGFDFDPFCRLVFSANDLPRHPKGGYAWNRRWIIVNFLNKFENSSDDKDLDTKLHTPLWRQYTVGKKRHYLSTTH